MDAERLGQLLLPVGTVSFLSSLELISYTDLGDFMMNLLSFQSDSVLFV